MRYSPLLTPKAQEEYIAHIVALSSVKHNILCFVEKCFFVLSSTGAPVPQCTAFCFPFFREALYLWQNRLLSRGLPYPVPVLKAPGQFSKKRQKLALFSSEETLPSPKRQKGLSTIGGLQSGGQVFSVHSPELTFADVFPPFLTHLKEELSRGGVKVFPDQVSAVHEILEEPCV